MLCELRLGDETLLYEPLALEDEVRAGRILPDQFVRFPPWTGAAFRRVDQIPALAEALDAPDARLAARLRGGGAAPGTVRLVALLGAWAAFQLGVGLARRAGVQLPGWMLALTAGGDVGWGSVVLDGRWWTLWTGALLHAGPLHLLGNLPVLAYSSWRVERAMGLGGQVLVGAASLAVGVSLIVLLGDYQAVGSSILAYGYWGAQIALGLRLGERIPAGWRGYYGWGNLVFFIPLFVAGLSVEGVSHLGHVGGLLGGIAVALFAPLETAVAASEVEGARRWSLRTAAGVLLAPVLVTGALARVPEAAGAPWTTVERPEKGLTLRVPARLARGERALAGLDGWAFDGEEDAWVYADVATVADPGSARELVVDWWRRRARAVVRADADAPAPRGEGWQVVTLTLVPADDRPVIYVEEQVRVRGHQVWRLGFQVPERRRGAPRVALYRAMLAEAVVGDPVELVQARANYAKDPTIPERAWRYAEALIELGEYGAADRVLAGLDAHRDGWEWEAARQRMALWTEDPALAEAADPAWVERFVREAPAVDTAILRPGLEWLAARDRCAVVDEELRRVARENPGLGERLASGLAEDRAACGRQAVREAVGSRLSPDGRGPGDR